MAFYYLKSAFRSLKLNSKFTIINIIGFAFGISICLAIVMFLMHEFSYDRYHKNADRIVRLTNISDNSSSIDYRVKDILLDNYSEFENGCLVQIVPRKISLVVDGNGFLVDGVASVDNSFFKVFTIDFLSEKLEQPLPDINSAVVTKSAAQKLFGTENAIGKEFLFQNRSVLKVTGVMNDFPENSSIKADVLVNAEEYKFSWSCENSDDLSSYRYPFRIYMQINENAGKHQLLAKVNKEIDLLQPYLKEVGFLPLKDMYLKDQTFGSQSKRGNLKMLELLSVIAFIILLLAVVNYINLTVAQQNKRKKNIGIRKTVGAFRNNLLYYFLSESVLMAFTSFFFSIILLWLFIPFYNSIFDTSLNISQLFKFPSFLIFVAGIFIVGILSGIGPALVFSVINPVKVFSGSTKKVNEKGYVRNSLTIFQFTISIGLILGV
ncbi:MAG: ABC transporter permease, partial [Prolixibacteraceae bacterium]|nr:ABC transporter permease [Prolixibacteraceae bacterium]